MECLIDYIGIKVCGTETSESGLFINSLPGISLESIDKIANADQVTFRGVWNDVQAEAAAIFYIDVITELTKCFSLQPYCDYEEMICENKVKLSNAWRYLLGSQLMVFRLFTIRLNRFTTIDANQAAELKNHYHVEYEKALSLAVKLMDVSACECMVCEPNPAYVTWIP